MIDEKIIITKEIKEINPINNKIVKSQVYVNVKECGLDFMLYRSYQRDNIKQEYYLECILKKHQLVATKQDLQKGRISGSKNISIPDSIVNAISGLHKARDTLGEQGYKIATYICGQDYSLAETREILNIKPRYMGERLREVLSDLADLYGYGNIKT